MAPAADPEHYGNWDDPDNSWGDDLLWAPASPEPPPIKSMSTIALNTRKMKNPEKLLAGQKVIEMGTGNPHVEGNAPYIATMTAKQNAFAAAIAAYEQARQACQEAMAARDAAEEEWMTAYASLGAYTQTATGGNPTFILSAGYQLRQSPQPPRPVAQIINMRVAFNGVPGKSIVTWKDEPNADAYRLQSCVDPITEDGWKDVLTVAEPKYEGNGAVPGKVLWYRAAGVNRLGQGPWSEPALRPVL